MVFSSRHRSIHLYYAPNQRQSEQSVWKFWNTKDENDNILENGKFHDVEI